MEEESTPTKFQYISKIGEPSQAPKTIWDKWVRYSYAINRQTPLQFLLPIMHWLGFLDMVLREWEPQFFSELPASNDSDSEIISATHKMFESYLWVLSAYEVIRTLSQKADENEELFGATVNKKIRETKHKLEEVRIPLAKLEPRIRVKKTKKIAGEVMKETALAFPAMHKKSFGWIVEPSGKFYSRCELADDILDLLKYMCENDKIENPALSGPRTPKSISPDQRR